MKTLIYAALLNLLTAQETVAFQEAAADSNSDRFRVSCYTAEDETSCFRQDLLHMQGIA